MVADAHVSLAVVFDVPEGKEFKSKFGEMYKLVREGTPEALYYGFATCGNRVLCREGYATAAGALAHGNDVRDILKGIIGEIGKERLKMLVMATEADLTTLRPHLEPLAGQVRFITLDSGSMSLKAMPKGCKDTHLAFLPEFIVPDGRMEEFKAGFAKFYETTKNGKGAAGCYYYGFGVEGNSVFCREGYVDAATVALHGEDVKDALAEPLKVVGAEGIKINVVGPKAMLDALRPKLEPRGAIMWELDDGALWR